MIRKTWHKQTYRRKIWRSYTLFQKIWYYMKPFVRDLINVWSAPFPVPTILKLFHSACLIVIILFPVIYPAAILLESYWVFQYIAQRDLGVELPRQLDLHNYIHRMRNIDPTGQYTDAVYYKCEKFKIFAAAVISLIDYVRLATTAIFSI